MSLEMIPYNERRDNELEVMELETALRNASLAFEYLRVELDGSQTRMKEFELTEKMETYKNAYFNARQMLASQYPERLEKLEQHLTLQKQQLFTCYNA